MDIKYQTEILFSWIAVVLKCIVVAEITCKQNQILRYNGLHDICCYTVQCGHNEYFEPCLFHNTNDTCKTCPADTCYDNAINTKNFREKPSGLCRQVDLQCNTHEGAYMVWKNGSCMPECKCNVSQGYYGFDDVSGGCRHTTKICNKPGEQLSSKTGECVACPDDQFKKEVKGFCINKTRCSEGRKIIAPGSTTEDRKCGFPSSSINYVTLKQNNPQKVNNVTQPGNNSTSNITSTHSESFPLETFGIIIGSCVFVFFLLLFVYIWARRRRSRNGASREIDEELVSLDSQEGSDVSCESCHKRVCTCLGAETQVKAYPPDDYHIEGSSSNATNRDPSSYRERGKQENILPDKRKISFNDPGKASVTAVVKPTQHVPPVNDRIEQVMNDDSGHVVPSGMSSITVRQEHAFQQDVQHALYESDGNARGIGVSSLTGAPCPTLDLNSFSQDTSRDH